MCIVHCIQQQSDTLLGQSWNQTSCFTFVFFNFVSCLVWESSEVAIMKDKSC